MNRAEPRLVLATLNPAKAKELRALIDPRVRIETMCEHPGIPMPEETCATFEENARMKAEWARDRLGLPALADDSGLVVDSLGGRPGVWSARYAPGSDAARWTKLLGELDRVSEDARTARFTCAVAFAAPSTVTLVVHGVVEGRIGRAPRGSGGFGYDPIFVLPDGRTMAELEESEKSSISHRGRALRAIRGHLERYFSLEQIARTP